MALATAIDNTFYVIHDQPYTDSIGIDAYDGETGVSFSLDSSTTHGQVSLLCSNSSYFTYILDYHFTGTDSFVYSVTDGDGNTTSATVTLMVYNSTPVGHNVIVSVDVGGGGGIGNISTPWTSTDVGISIDSFLDGSITSDDDSDNLTIVITSPPSIGSLTVNPDGSMDYQPYDCFGGTDTFQYQVTDQLSTSDTYTVVIPVPDAGNDSGNATSDVSPTPTPTLDNPMTVLGSV